MSRDAARRAARAAIDATGMSRDAWAEQADVDPKTLATFLSGKRWPHPATRQRIEAALGWPSAALADIEEGMSVEEVLGTAGRLPAVTQAATGEVSPPELPYFDVVHAIRNDPDLLPEAKEHLERQYGLLRRLNPEVSRESVQQRVTEEKLVELRTRRQPKKVTDKTDEPAPRKAPAKRPR